MGQIITVNFRGDQLYGFENDDGIFVAVKPIVESMGLDWNGQYQRLKRDPILSEGMCVMHIPFGRGGAQECVCLKLELINGWLFTIDSGRIKDEATHERVLIYQRECYGVLFGHFHGRQATEQPQAAGAPSTEETIPTRKQMVALCESIFGAQAARELWFKLKLPVTPSMFEDPRQADLFHYTAIKRDDPQSGKEAA